MKVARLTEGWLGLPGNARGALWMLASAVGFVLMAGLIKTLGQRLDNFQIAFFRCAVGFLALLPLVAHHGLSAIRTRRLGTHMMRGVSGSAAIFCSYYAISHLALAAYTALSFTRPLFTTLLAVVILGEHVRWRRWSATALGFVGVLVMVHPGAGAFGRASIFALIDSFSVALSVTLLKRLPPDETPLTMLFWFGLFSTMASIGPAWWFWVPPTRSEYGLLIVMGILGVSAQSFIIRAFRAGEASIVAPFDYSRLIVASLVGYFAFAEVPDHWTLIGALIIIASTLYIAHREARFRVRAG